MANDKKDLLDSDLIATEDYVDEKIKNINLLDDVNDTLNTTNSALKINEKIADNKLTTLEEVKIVTDKINMDLDEIRLKLDSKADAETNHTHTQLAILEKINEADGEITFNSKKLMTKDEYDSDNNGIVNKSDVAIKIEGQLITLDELNALAGIKGNVQDLIDALTTGMIFMGEYATVADRDADITSPEHGYQVIIKNDENYDGVRTQYIYSSVKGMWLYAGGYPEVNDATSTAKGLVQLSGDLTGSASAPSLINTVLLPVHINIQV